ncbi:AMP-binding protein [Paracoccus sp. JM45]|uniref:AMP-binding protein n=1 Tax=Paracoccus sp. JM45 TaxID=2283626 RepID=UPI000E6D17CB|nr:AMP-binding protein [Paracoccus sp. JM45]RJE79165.1 acyl-CoA synthetase [Paracoccus sp. JM45]
MADLIYHTRHWAGQDPDRLAFHMCDTAEDVSFRALEDRANQGAHLLRQLGLQRQDHLMVLLENRREFLEICFAADRSGLYYTTASTHLSQEELAYIIRDCGANVLVTSEQFAALTDAIARQMPDLTILTCDEWNQRADRMPATPIKDEAQGLDMLYSSGTTGRPKGIKWPMPNDPPGSRTMLIDLLGGLFGYERDTRYLSPAPLYHAAPLRHSMVTIKSGGSAFIMGKFDAEKSLALIQTHHITHSQWVPTMFVRMLKLPDDIRGAYVVSSMQMAVHAAAPCPIDVKERMIDWWGPVIHEYYAGTENNGFTALDTVEWLTHPGSVGRAKLGRIHICDEDGHELPSGAEGEIYFENGHQFIYHNDPEKTAASRNAQGWTTLGDIGRVDPAGYLYLTDRKSFVIISGGVNIYPQEAENALLAHPDVLDAAVIGIPNEDFGEEVKAVVQTTTGQASPALEQELIEWCRARLSVIKCPRSIDFRKALPRTETGKLFKRKLWQEYRQP